MWDPRNFRLHMSRRRYCQSSWVSTFRGCSMDPSLKFGSHPLQFSCCSASCTICVLQINQVNLMLCTWNNQTKGPLSLNFWISVGRWWKSFIKVVVHRVKVTAAVWASSIYAKENTLVLCRTCVPHISRHQNHHFYLSLHTSKYFIGWTLEIVGGDLQCCTCLDMAKTDNLQ